MEIDAYSYRAKLLCQSGADRRQRPLRKWFKWVRESSLLDQMFREFLPLLRHRFRQVTYAWGFGPRWHLFIGATLMSAVNREARFGFVTMQQRTGGSSENSAVWKSAKSDNSQFISGFGIYDNDSCAPTYTRWLWTTLRVQTS